LFSKSLRRIDCDSAVSKSTYLTLLENLSPNTLLKGFDKAKSGSRIKEIYQGQIRLYAQENRVSPQENTITTQAQNKLATQEQNKVTTQKLQTSMEVSR
jgi:hypothetical protein